MARKTKSQLDAERARYLVILLEDNASSCELFQVSFQSYLQRMREFRERAEYKRLSGQWKSYLFGYEQCLFTHMQRKMVWLLWDRHAGDGEGAYVENFPYEKRDRREYVPDFNEHPGYHAWPSKDGGKTYRRWS